MKNLEKTDNRLDRHELIRKLSIAAVAACMVAVGSVVTAFADDPSHRPIALTESGVVIGATTSGVNEFLGIPYAAPPVGDLRWRS
jgi:para-nitrobenzyl esterase